MAFSWDSWLSVFGLVFWFDISFKNEKYHNAATEHFQTTVKWCRFCTRLNEKRCFHASKNVCKPVGSFRLCSLCDRGNGVSRGTVRCHPRSAVPGPRCDVIAMADATKSRHVLRIGRYLFLLLTHPRVRWCGGFGLWLRVGATGEEK